MEGSRVAEVVPEIKVGNGNVSALSPELRPAGAGGRIRTCDLSITSRSNRHLRTGHCSEVVLPEINVAWSWVILADSLSALPLRAGEK